MSERGKTSWEPSHSSTPAAAVAVMDAPVAMGMINSALNRLVNQISRKFIN